MSAHGQIHSPGPNDWVEQLRQTLRQEPPPSDEAILEAAYDASEIDTATLFDYCEGRLSEEERQEVEAEVMASPHTLRKLTRVGAIVAQSQSGALAAPGRVASPITRAQNYQTPSASSSSDAASDSVSLTRPPVVSRARLGPPRPSLGHSLPRPEDCTRLSPDSDCEVYRSLEKNRDQLRIYYQSAPAGTLLSVRLSTPSTGTRASSNEFTQFVVLRRGSESSSTSTLTIPLSFKQGEVDLELAKISLAELTAEDASLLLNSYERAAEDDPIAVTPLHEPRSAWQSWADEVLTAPSAEVPPALREIAELIATS